MAALKRIIGVLSARFSFRSSKELFIDSNCAAVPLDVDIKCSIAYAPRKSIGDPFSGFIGEIHFFNPSVNKRRRRWQL
jgi:hypothetical protein